MNQKTLALPAFDLERVRTELQSPAYKARIEQVLRDVASLKSRAVIDRARLFIPVTI